ncbi:hypothetical protein MCOR02_003167 [Pyricularia oryzae]|uniref:Uncharacterized protein n=1 Tax=Pyricularia oryzae TaxID=318829 RepID=A0A4P7N7R4_PYROR|nr:hypothetical protein MCOR01_008942 [Pyricularia oryzae]KAH9439626.1 hypothetical protein MCOR02_003167 [Pyricularia oryzae]KAI6307411.1 hypothetical protein MCOR30_011678 [Pyricularia oryzae]KAI6312464.1 hypothetical protein MCOR34_005581 [Pyricularia oryzae]KAI6363589.1 hypothetical protein MCOR31_007778 [Pyricularia oryzae]
MDEADGKIVGALGKDIEGSDWLDLARRELGSGDASPLDRHCNLAPGPRTSARRETFFGAHDLNMSLVFFYTGSDPRQILHATPYLCGFKVACCTPASAVSVVSLLRNAPLYRPKRNGEAT